MTEDVRILRVQANHHHLGAACTVTDELLDSPRMTATTVRELNEKFGDRLHSGTLTINTAIDDLLEDFRTDTARSVREAGYDCPACGDTGPFDAHNRASLELSRTLMGRVLVVYAKSTAVVAPTFWAAHKAALELRFGRVEDFEAHDFEMTLNVTTGRGHVTVADQLVGRLVVVAPVTDPSPLKALLKVSPPAPTGEPLAQWLFDHPRYELLYRVLAEACNRATPITPDRAGDLLASVTRLSDTMAHAYLTLLKDKADACPRELLDAVHAATC